MRKQRTNGRRTTPNSTAPQLIEVTFSLHRPDAREVYLCGDFNQWSSTSLQMIPCREKSCWEKRLALEPGRYQYKFLVDGQWMHNPKAAENVPNDQGSLNSVIEVRV